MSNSCPWDWRIALVEADLAGGPFRVWEIPVPTIGEYNSSSVEVARGEGEQALHGYATYKFMWDVMSRQQANRVRQFIDAAKTGTGWLYMTVDLTDDSSVGIQWADIRGKPHRDYKAADAGSIIGRLPGSSGHFDNYSLMLNAVDVVNNPSIFTTR